jgi:hypothetical protein
MTAVSPVLSIIQLNIARVLQWSPCILVALWVVGVSTKDWARVVLAALFVYIASGQRLADSMGVRWGRTALAIVPFVFPITNCLSQICRVYLGEHGIDFAIFTQAIRSVRDSGIPVTTLVGPKPVDFMSHHFFPFVYALGWSARIALPPHIIGIVVQGFSIAVAIWCFYRFSVTRGIAKHDAAWITCLLCLNPCFRSGVSWGIHDEVLALGLVGLAMIAWTSNRWGLLALALIGVGAFKET